MPFPFLSTIVFVPAVSSLVILTLPAQRKDLLQGQPMIRH